MSKVEEVAKAICDEVNDQSYDALPEAATYLERKTHVDRAILDRREARQVARAAIEAMREPNDAMKVNGGIAIEQAAFEQGKVVFEAAGDAFQAMISAALNEEG